MSKERAPGLVGPADKERASSHLHVAQRRLRREDRVRVIPADDLHLPTLDGLPHLHLRKRVKLHMDRAGVG